MKKIVYFSAVGGTFLVLLLLANGWDRQSAKNADLERLAKCDEALMKQEQRYLSSLELLQIRETDVPSITQYRNASNRKERLDAFSRVISESQSKVTGNVENLLVRRGMDELNGAANRHEIVAKECLQ